MAGPVGSEGASRGRIDRAKLRASAEISLRNGLLTWGPRARRDATGRAPLTRWTIQAQKLPRNRVVMR